MPARLLPFEVTILRNGLYAEVPVGLATAAAASAAETGVLAAAFGAGRLSVVAKEDLADIAVRVEVLSDALDRPVEYRPVSLFTAREALAGSGLEPYQITHTLSLFSNLSAGYLQAHSTDLTTLLPAKPRSVRDQIVQAVKEGGYQSRSVSSRSVTSRT